MVPRSLGVVQRILFFLVSPQGVMLANFVIILMMIGSLPMMTSAAIDNEVKDLRAEGISTLVVAWGVLLESRTHIIEHVLHWQWPESRQSYEAENTKIIENGGLTVLLLGLALEFVIYFDDEARVFAGHAVQHEWSLIRLLVQVLDWSEWLVAALLLVVLLKMCFDLVRQLRFRGRS